MTRFWEWYNRHYALNITIAAGLFALQIIHLVWLTFDPLWTRLLGDALVELDKPWSWPLLLVDYTEIPALVTVTLVYVNELRKGFAWRPILYIAFLNSQWLHIFWITDEFVVSTRNGDESALPAWLAYVAISIDYLELPVMLDTLRRVVAALRELGFGALRPQRAERT